jgi:hypothetical protein
MGLVASGCARPQVPQGGPVPEIPLQVRETKPANLSFVEPFTESVEIWFAQTVAENLTQGSLREAVIVSPANGEIEVRTGEDRIEISMEGGFQAITVYRVTVLPRFQDRFQNAMGAAFDLFFSTGPEFEPNLVAGLISNRLTLDAVREGRVDLISADGDIVQTAVADTMGVFTFPYLFSGVYTVVAYEDDNRDGEPGVVEIQDSVGVSVTQGDTLIITDLELLSPDSTAAVLNEVSVLDSTMLQLNFDDYLDPNEPLDGVEATVASEDGDPIEVSEVIHFSEWEDRQAAGAEPGPNAAGAAAQTDSGAVANELLLPVQDLVLILSAPPVPDEIYEVRVQGVRNINGVPGGGGLVDLIWVPTTPPDEVPSLSPDAPGGATVPADFTAVPGGLSGSPAVPSGGGYFTGSQLGA